MKHAFLIIAHNNWNQLCRLIASIDSEKCDFFIHINSKIDLKKEITDKIKLSAEKSKITFSERVPITWGDFGICKASLVMLRTAINSGGGYDYYHLLTGSDLLLKNIDEFDLFFVKNLYSNKDKGKKTNYINVGLLNKKMASRIYYYNFFISWWRNPNFIVRKTATMSNSLLGLFQKCIGIDRWRKTGMKLHHGSSWWSLSDEFAEYFLSKFDWIENQFGKRTFAADEFIPQTIIMNSPFKESIYIPNDSMDRSLRLIDWKRGNGYGSPHIWRIDDKEEVLASKNLIGRKFDENVDNEIIDCVINKIQN